MRYLSVCSGVEAATVAWHGLGWQPVAFSEIEKFPSQVLAHHYPDVPNLGDMTKYKEWNFGTSGLDLLVGGTPCQSFSVAGLRKGLEDPRGNLALVYCGILDKFRPKWFVWENVPGVLSSGKGRDFGSFLGALAELGYGWSYRVLDAQHFGVPQRRRRVFVVKHLGDWRPTAQVLFESESLSRNTKTSRKPREKTASSFTPSIANCLQTTCNDYSRADGFNMIAHVADKCPTITSSASGYSRVGNGVTEHETYVAYALQGSGSTSQSANGSGYKEEQSFTLNVTDVHGVAYSFDSLASNSMKSKNPHSGCREVDKSKTIDTTYPCPSKNQGGIGIMQDMAVRRLTPVECERLQGFPDNYTNIRENCPDGPRYKAMGNSMAVPVMRWIGERIKMVEESQ
jgi:DNA (cytosine-5)-methyltransferase 1